MNARKREINNIKNVSNKKREEIADTQLKPLASTNQHQTHIEELR